jgi:hypothetical protein
MNDNRTNLAATDADLETPVAPQRFTVNRE